MIDEDNTRPIPVAMIAPAERPLYATSAGLGLKDRTLWVFVAAMILFHIANAPAGVYLGLFLKGDLHATDGLLSWVFVVSMIAWMLVVRPAGWLADRLGRRPLLLVGWSAMTVRLVLIAMAQSSWQILAIQVLDGLAQGIFIVLAAAWTTDRLADHKRIGEAQAPAGSTRRGRVSNRTNLIRPCSRGTRLSVHVLVVGRNRRYRNTNRGSMGA